MEKIAEQKKIVIYVRATRNKKEAYRDALLTPGVRVADVLEQLELDSHRLEKPEGGYFSPIDDPYEAVESGQKVNAVKGKAEAGS
jgi:hypothetical protein